MKNLDLNTSPVLPESSGSVEGATSGAMADASMVDLKKGYHQCQDKNPEERDSLMLPLGGKQTGFLNRPQGWER